MPPLARLLGHLRPQPHPAAPNSSAPTPASPSPPSPPLSPSIARTPSPSSPTSKRTSLSGSLGSNKARAMPSPSGASTAYVPPFFGERSPSEPEDKHRSSQDSKDPVLKDPSLKDDKRDARARTRKHRSAPSKTLPGPRTASSSADLATPFSLNWPQALLASTLPPPPPPRSRRQPHGRTRAPISSGRSSSSKPISA